MDNNVKIIYNKLENMKTSNQSYIDLSELNIEEKKDLVNVCDIFRDSRYETFRIFYMRNNRIVGQEAITSRIPDAVMIFRHKGNPTRTYEKMTNRMQRLNATGYYLAHNHPSDSALPSQEDMKITNEFAQNVKGFLGHIVLGNSNRYSIIEKNEYGEILIPKEKTLIESTINSIDEKLKNKTFYDIKISSRVELVALLQQIQNEQEYSVAILADSKNNIRMVLDIPNKMFNQNTTNLNGFFKNIARNCGANKVFIGTHDQKTYFKIIEHQRYGTIKDMIYFDNNNRIITEKITKSPNLFDNEKKQKRREAR